MICQSTTRLVFLCLLLGVASRAQGGWLGPSFDLPGANGPIQSLVEFHGALYAVGNFTHIAGVNAPGVARWDGTNWVAVEPGFNATVVAATASGDAMYFTAFHNRLDQLAGLLRWDGSVWTALGTPQGYRDVIGPPLVNRTEIYTEVFPDTSSGDPFLTLAVAKWDGSTWSVLAPTEFVGEGSALSGLAAAQGHLYAAGTLYTSNGFAYLNLGELVQNSWVPIGGGVGPGLFIVSGLASDGSNLFVYGAFHAAGSQSADGFAIWDGTQWIVPSAASRGGLSVQALTANGREILASEAKLAEQYLVQYDGTNRTVLARGDAGAMGVMRRWRDGIYCTGDFDTVGGVRTGNLALWTGTNWTRVGNGNFLGLSAQATCLAVAGTNVYAAGFFQYAGDLAANGIARWDGRNWHPLGSGVDGTVLQMASRGDDLFVIGTFTSAGGVNVTNVARWDGAVWSNLGGGLNGALTAIVANEHFVFVARKLDASNFVISRWDGNTWGDVVGGTVEYGVILTMLASEDSILVGGIFQKLNGEEVNNVARWSGGQWHSLGGGLTGHKEQVPNEGRLTTVRALLFDGTNLYAGGSFTNAGGIGATNVARWNGSQWSALGEGIPGFDRCFSSGCVYPVTSLALVQGKLFVGGGFNGNGTGLRYLAAWDGTNWSNALDGSWTLPNRSYSEGLHVWALASRGGDLYVAGNFGTIGGLPSYGFAIWHEGNPPVLRQRLEGGSLVLSWPRLFQYATVEFTESLRGQLWKPVTNLNWKVTMTNDVEVAITPAGAPVFYRLRLP